MATDIRYGVCYSPTWTTWSPPYSNSGTDAQFSDADFFNSSFQALWNTGSDSNGNVYRDDLATIASAFNLVRLYNWDPTRGWDSSTSVGSAHLGFLNYASAEGLQVIIPISNYFLSDDTYAWDGNNPTSDYSFAGAPTAIQNALLQFLGSVTDPSTGQLHAAVHSFAVANEIDLNDLVGQGTSGSVDPASRLARVVWWIVNLQGQISSQSLGQVLLTSPISNADQGNPGTSPMSYWFQAFVNGVTNTTPLPQGTAGGSGNFQASWNGLSSFSWYADWYYNSVNIYQLGNQLTGTLGQYDDWTSNTVNDLNWPGQQFAVPLLLTEIGVERGTPSSPANQAAQSVAVTQLIAMAVATYLAGAPNSLLMGYCIYEFNDEAYLNANWGLFLSGASAYQEPTGTTVVSYATWPSVDYPVDQLTPVGLPLITALSEIFALSTTLGAANPEIRLSWGTEGHPFGRDRRLGSDRRFNLG